MNSNFTLAVHSLIYLALQPGRMSTSDAIAESACVHPVRIRKVLSLLKRHEFIESKEGAGGGFICSLDLSEINLWNIYQITAEGALQPRCPKPNEDCVVGANMQKVLLNVFLGAEQHLGDYLMHYTIQDLADLITTEDHNDDNC